MSNQTNIFNALNFLSDVVGIKERKARQIRFFRYQDGHLGIAFFDDQTIYSEYWLENLSVPKQYELIFNSSGLKLDIKYDLSLFGLKPFSADKNIFKFLTVQKRVLALIFDAIQSSYVV